MRMGQISLHGFTAAAAVEKMTLFAAAGPQSQGPTDRCRIPRISRHRVPGLSAVALTSRAEILNNNYCSSALFPKPSPAIVYECTAQYLRDSVTL